MAASFELSVRSTAGIYRVAIGPGTFTAALEGGADLILADRFLAPHLAGHPVPVVWIDVAEERKNLAYAEELILACREAGARRGTRLLAAGGGVVQDLVTLVASLYMRGLAWSFAPTTLMSMADSCIGGKSSINAGGVKNLVGNVYPPRAVAVDPTFLATLPREAIVAGLAEAAKICYCRNAAAFDEYLVRYEAFEAGEAAPLLFHVLDSKRWFVEIDEFDRKERRLLNFGHTFGHALEAATSFRVSHGVAVALGMLCALEFDRDRWRSDPPASGLLEHCRALVASVPDLSSRLEKLDEKRFETAFRSDKKHRAGELHLILPGTNGAEEVVLPDEPATWERVQSALRQVVSWVAP